MINKIITPSITLKEIIIKYNDDVQDKYAQDYIDKIGQYPFVIFNGLILEYKYFIDFKLYNDLFLPRLEMKFRDMSNKMIDSMFPLDDNKISIFIKSPSENLLPIRMDFKIVEFNPIKNEVNSEDVVYNLKGILDVSSLYFTIFGSYKGTSLDVLKNLAQELGLGFATNIENTNDQQTWINPADTKIDFIEDITLASYKSDDSFMLSYVDFYYNLNYIDIETQFGDSTNLKGLSNNTFIINNNEENLQVLFLTNHPDAYGSNNYISKYNLLNESTNVNLEIGYFGEITYYKKIEKEMSIYMLDTISTENDNNVVLKSNSDDSTENLYNFGGSHVYFGTIDTDNIHNNYHYAVFQNLRNVKYFQKVRMKVILPVLNFNLYRFQMINVKLYKMQEMDSKVRYTSKGDINELAGKNIYEDKLNKRLSGDWMITGINFRFNPDNGWEQEINLSRRELSVSEL
jgi:hypothetical protein